MKRKIKSKTQRGTPQKVRREHEPLPWRYLLLTIFCGALLVTGFFGAARQHFASIDYGIRNSKLRKQVDELKSEQRRLLLSREVALSPAEIKKAAHKIGFREMTASNIQSFPAGDPDEGASANKAEEPKPEKTIEKEKGKRKKEKEPEPDKKPEKRPQTAAGSTTRERVN